ncbi:hypothetical protein L596_030609 [Steinernema carpocapsae]|uniref:Uncharacterized protein n=1 Tax=Steinernema carpocapsae TaxID=34508 RepID=A0A4U5LPY5_STECR|nr:hypothetical protein L596_030609 [Steinernema carpocapsae]
MIEAIKPASMISTNSAPEPTAKLQYYHQCQKDVIRMTLDETTQTNELISKLTACFKSERLPLHFLHSFEEQNY